MLSLHHGLEQFTLKMIRNILGLVPNSRAQPAWTSHCAKQGRSEAASSSITEIHANGDREAELQATMRCRTAVADHIRGGEPAKPQELRSAINPQAYINIGRPWSSHHTKCLYCPPSWHSPITELQWRIQSRPGKSRLRMHLPISR